MVIDKRFKICYQVHEDDTLHQKFVQRFYNQKWDDPSSFGLVLNTHSLSIETAVQLIMESTRALERQAPAQGAVTTDSIVVDRVLADTVVKVLGVPARPTQA